MRNDHYNNLKITVSVFIITVFLGYAEAIRCYHCTVGPTASSYRNQSEKLCLKFEQSEYYEIDCPYSTMCMKKIFRLPLLNGTIKETYMRGCAQQKYTEQVYRGGHWQKEASVEEPYQEGCREADQKSPGGISTIYCHCRGSYCNTAPKDSNGYHTDAMAVIFVFNAMKYLRYSEF